MESEELINLFWKMHDNKCHDLRTNPTICIINPVTFEVIKSSRLEFTALNHDPSANIYRLFGVLIIRSFDVKENDIIFALI